MIKDLISIIIPVYNTKEYLKECILSVLNQTYKNIEIILVDDGSSDGSEKICDEYSKKDSRIKVIHLENGGVSRARNIGIDNAIGEYITFVDSDDIIEKKMYEEMYKAIFNSKSEIAICNYEPNLNFYKISNEITSVEALNYILDTNKFRGFVFNKLYKKSILGKLRFSEDIYICEDLLFNCEYLIKCNKCCIVNKQLYIYNKRENSAINSKTYSYKKETSLKAYKKLHKIYRDNAIEYIDKLNISNIKEYTYIYYLRKQYNKKKIVKNKEINDIYIDIMKSHNVNIKKKIIIFMYYRFPVLIQSMRYRYYKINKYKR